MYLQRLVQHTIGPSREGCNQLRVDKEPVFGPSRDPCVVGMLLELQLLLVQWRRMGSLGKQSLLVALGPWPQQQRIKQLRISKKQ